MSNKPHLCWVDLALDDVKDGDVAVISLTLHRRRHHHVLRLQQASHYVKYGRLAYARHLKIDKKIVLAI